MSAPRTYAAAIKVAEPVTREVLDALVAESKGSVTVFEKNKQRKHCSSVRYLTDRVGCRSLWLTHASPRSGYQTGSSIYLSNVRPPVFDFYQQGRIVRVVISQAEVDATAANLAKVTADLEAAVQA